LSWRNFLQASENQTNIDDGVWIGMVKEVLMAFRVGTTCAKQALRSNSKLAEPHDLDTT